MYRPSEPMPAPATAGHRVKRVLFALVLLTATMAHTVPVSVIHAQEPASRLSRTFDIPPQPLSSALLQFSDDTNLELLFDAAMTRDMRTQGVSGNHTAEER